MNRKSISTTLALTLIAVGWGVTTAQTSEAATTGVRALSVAASKKGSPYQWGATGPYRFDCSGLTLYSFKRVGKTLPRTTQSQYNKAHHISKASLRPGDLVFFYSGSNIYHVGIYAGGGKIWHAPHTGARVRLEKIWTSHVKYGRFS